MKSKLVVSRQTVGLIELLIIYLANWVIFPLFVVLLATTPAIVAYNISDFLVTLLSRFSGL